MRDHISDSAADEPLIEPTDSQVDQYLAGELPSGSIQPIAQAIEAKPEWRRYVRLLTVWLNEPDIPAGPNVLDALARFKDAQRFQNAKANNSVQWEQLSGEKAQLAQKRKVLLPQDPSGAIVGLGNRSLRVWTGIVVSLLGTVFLLKHRDPSPSATADISRVYTTTAQQQAVINFADGSRVTLAPSSTLRLSHFGMRSRTVNLDNGEAYFQVAHAAGVPFIVKSGAAVAQVLGTNFLVRHAASDPHVYVAVTDGKIKVTSPARPDVALTLTNGQVSDVTDSTAQVRTTDDLAPGAEWAPGRIMFRHMPLATVLKTVTQWYGYQFRFTDSTLSTRSVTVMMSTRSSAEALAAIEHVLAVNLTITGDTITLVSHPPQSIRGATRIRTYDVWTPTREVGR